MARKLKGRIFTRGKNKYYYLQFYVNGQQIVKALRDENNKPITNRIKAQAAADIILAPYMAKDDEQRREQALAALQTAKQKAIDLEVKANPPLKVSEAWESYLNAPNRPDSGERTLKDYKQYFTAFESWLNISNINIKYLQDILPCIASDYASSITRSGKSPNTYNKHIGFLKLFFRVLEIPSRILENPFEKITKKKLKTQSRRELTVEELYKILDSATGDLKLLLSVGTFTGLRLGDCCTLKWGEIDLIKQVIRRIPNKTASRNSSKPVLIGIPTPLSELLVEIPATNRRGFLFPKLAQMYQTENKRSTITRQIQKHFEMCGICTQKAGTGKGTGKRAIVEVGFHSLRHTYVSLHAERGTPAAMIQNIVGHSNPAMTRHYTHVNVDAARRTANVLSIPRIADENNSERKQLIEQIFNLSKSAKLETLKCVIDLLKG
jgi:integrase